MELIDDRKIALHDEITLKLTLKEYLTLYAMVGSMPGYSVFKAVENIAFIEKELAEEFIAEYTKSANDVYSDMGEINKKLGITDEDYWGRGY